MRQEGCSRGFTLIELLTVVAIIILVTAMALPNFVAVMKGQRWSSAVTNVQVMVMRARALAGSVRQDFSVEFDVQDNGTKLWLESEVNTLERLPNLWDVEHQIGGGIPLIYFLGVFSNSGGSYKSWRYECTCTKCGYQWVDYTGGQACPQCGANGWPYNPQVASYHYDFAYDPSKTQAYAYGDNAKQSQVISLGSHLTIDVAGSPNFINWDDPKSVECYGWDYTRDIRVSMNGALVQTLDPVICLKDVYTGERKKVKVVRCTGRLVPWR
jgi:prepilin-type N-terminal cleavage/methylation domain-containing protein